MIARRPGPRQSSETERFFVQLSLSISLKEEFFGVILQYVLVDPGIFLRQFDEDAARAGRVNKSHQRAAGADARLFIDQSNAARFQIFEFRREVRDLNADVMNAGAAFGDEFSD